MMVEVEAKVIVTKTDGSQEVVENPSSITVSVSLLNNSFTTFKTIEDIVKKGW